MQGVSDTSIEWGVGEVGGEKGRRGTWLEVRRGKVDKKDVQKRIAARGGDLLK